VCSWGSVKSIDLKVRAWAGSGLPGCSRRNERVGPRTLGVAFLELVPHDRFAAQTDTAWKPTARSPVRSREGRLIASWPDMRSPTHRIPAKEIRMQSMDLPLRVQYLQRRATSSPSLDAQRSKPPCRQLGSWDAFLRTPHHIPCIGIRKLAFDPSHFGSRIRSLLRPCASCLLILLSPCPSLLLHLRPILQGPRPGSSQ